jgi:glycyl-tRNA synthetase
MVEPKTNELMEKIVSLCKRRGFIFQSSEIYGGINGFWDYGPLGAELKRNVKDAWWRAMTRDRDDVVGLDASIIMHPKIWEASGHTSTFSDPMVDCLLTGKRFRADQIEPQSGDVYYFRRAFDLGYTDESLAWLAKICPNNLSWSQRRQAGESSFKIALDNCLLINRQLELEVPEPDSTIQSQTEFILGISLAAARSKNPDISKDGNNLLKSLGTREYQIDFAVLVPAGTSAEKAKKTAKEFYRKRMVLDPEPTLDRIEKVENSTHFNPENGSLLTEPRAFNLMFKTYVGPVESEDNVAYLRPETAQAIFAQFKNVLDSSRVKVPFGIAQIGKAFRNEINPRNFTFRSREFEQMELEFFIKPDEVVKKMEEIRRSQTAATEAAGSETGAPTDTLKRELQTGALQSANWGWKEWHEYWVEERVKWYESIGLERGMLEFYHQPAAELAHYAKATVDILYKFPFGAQELEGIAARGDFDLTQHQKFSGKSMEYFDEEAKLKYIPHVIEPSAGVDRLTLALICNAFHEDQAPDDKGKMETRVVLKFHPRIAPIKAAVFPLLKNKPELVKKALAVRDLLRPHLTVFYDEAGAIGRRYRRQDEIGTPFGVTIDFDTLGEKPELLDTVTLRERDTMQQTRVKISELAPLLLEKIR